MRPRPVYAMAMLWYAARAGRVAMLKMLLLLWFAYSASMMTPQLPFAPAMAITRVQSKELSGALSSGTGPAFTSNVAAGNLLVLLASQTSTNNRPITSVTDSLGQTWVLAKKQGTYGTSPVSQIWYFKNTAGGACTLTITWSNGADSSMDFLALEYSGCDTVSPLDVTDGVTETSSTSHNFASASDTTSSNGSVILGIGSLNGTAVGFAPGGSFVSISAANGNTCWAEWITSTAQTTTGPFTITNSRTNNGVMCSFKATAGVAARQQSLTLTGCGV